MASGLCAALAGLAIASHPQAAHPATGETFALNAIAAAVLGGTESYNDARELRARLT